MTIWIPKIDHRPAPRYRAIAEAISDAIASGELPSGTRLPPQRDLAWRLGVTVGTVTRAYDLAAQRGLPIGRASGRERVCQYVSVMGGAIYFKNKEDTNRDKRIIPKIH